MIISVDKPCQAFRTVLQKELMQGPTVTCQESAMFRVLQLYCSIVTCPVDPRFRTKHIPHQKNGGSSVSWQSGRSVRSVVGWFGWSDSPPGTPPTALRHFAGRPCTSRSSFNPTWHALHASAPLIILDHAPTRQKNAPIRLDANAPSWVSCIERNWTVPSRFPPTCG